jgi:LysM repeat protein
VTTAVTLTVPGAPAKTRVQAELTLLGAGGNTTIVLPITDPAATYTNLEGNWVEVDVPGAKPFNVRAGSKLSMLQLQVTIAGPDGGTQDSGNVVQPIIQQLLQMCGSDGTYPIALTWGSLDSSAQLTQTGHWHIDSLEIDSTWRQPGTNNISQATATIQLKEVNDPPTVSATVAAWVAPPAAPAGVSSSSAAAPSTYTVRQGDTIYSIAAAVYGNPEPGWRDILAANDITDARTLAVGQQLIIPAIG